MMRNAACWPFHTCDCHIANHSPPTVMKPTNQIRNAQPAASENEPLGVMKVPRREVSGAKKLERSEREQDRCHRLADDDQPESDRPQNRDRQGVGRHRARRQDRVHAEDVLHELEVRLRIMDVSDGDETA